MWPRSVLHRNPRFRPPTERHHRAPTPPHLRRHGLLRRATTCRYLRPPSIITATGISPTIAAQIADLRESRGAFVSAEDVAAATESDPQLVRHFAEHTIYLSPGQIEILWGFRET
jgi:hypothetical protein